LRFYTSLAHTPTPPDEADRITGGGELPQRALGEIAVSKHPPECIFR
jgi:hypothetical protein